MHNTLLLALPLCEVLASCAPNQSAVHAQTTQSQTILSNRQIYVAADAKLGDGSAAKPYATITDAVGVAQAGDTIVVSGGVYRERIVVPARKPLTIKAKAGERVVISGAETIGEWRPFRDKIFVTTVSGELRDLYVHSMRQPMAREPNAGWYTVQSTGGSTGNDGNIDIYDTAHLVNRQDTLAGGHAQFFQRTGTQFYSKPIVGQTGGFGTITIDPENDKGVKLKAGDGYILENRLSLLDQPGEWATEPATRGRFDVYFWPRSADDLKNTASSHIAENLIFARDAQNLTLEGLEVTGSAGKGIEINNSSDVRINRCLVHDNASTGIALRQIKNAVVSNCLSLHNGNGIMALSAHNLTIEENEVAFNDVDGIVIAGDVARYGQAGANPDDETDGVVVRRNYIHHHILFGHPDNIQLYRGVKNIKISENLALGAGQALMTEEVDGAELTGNVFLSSAAFLIIFGHENSHNWKISHNTFGLPGYGIYLWSGHNYDAQQNVYLGNVTTVASYSGDYNLYGAGFDAAKSPGEDSHSKTQAPLLTNVPQTQAVIENQPDSINTADSLTLRGGKEWRVGDTIEVNWDGVARKITANDGQHIGFAPALVAKPTSNFAVVANWGAAQSLALDTRPSAQSPARKLGPDGQAIGATLDCAAYRRGDFDGDGKRDLPDVPADVKAGLPDPNNLILPAY